MRLFRVVPKHLLLLLLPLLCFCQVAFMQYTLKWDVMDSYFPYRYFIGECLSQEQGAWWNPYLHLGSPFHANPDNGFWYLPVYVLGWNGYSLADLHIEFSAHLLLAAGGMYALLRRQDIVPLPACCFGASYGACGFFVSNAQHFSYLIGAAWLPWLLWGLLGCLERPSARTALALALPASFMFTGGYPSIFIISAYCCLAYSLYWLWIRRGRHPVGYWRGLTGSLLLSALTFGAAAAAMAYSVLEARDLFTRGEGVSPEKALVGAFMPPATLSLLAPWATVAEAERLGSDASMLNAYMGLAALLFAPLGLASPYKRRYFWGAMGLFSLLASFGTATPLRLWLYHYVPLMDLFRFPAVFRLFFMLSVFVLAAQGIQHHLTRQQGPGRLFWAVGVFWCLCLTVLALAALSKGGAWALPAFWNFESYETVARPEYFWHRLFSQSLIQIVLLLTMLATLQWKPLWFWGVVAADLFLSVQLNLNGTVTSDRPFGELQAALAQAPQGFPNPGSQIIEPGYRHLPEYLPAYYNHHIYTKTIAESGYNPFQLKAFERYEQSEQGLAQLQKPLFYGNNREKEPQLVEFSPNRLTVHCAGTDTLRWLQTYYPRWAALADGQSAAIQEDDNGLMRLALPAGTERVELSYQYGDLRRLQLLQWLVQGGGCILLLFFALKERFTSPSTS